MQQDNLTIIGTSHIAKQSLEEVKNAIETKKPDIVAVELDKKRFYSLMSPKSKNKKISFYDIRRVGIKGFLFSLIGSWGSKKLGDMVGVSPGEEMKTAIKLAKKNNAKIALIDQDIEITLKRFSKYLSWKERWNFLADILGAFFKKNKNIKIDFDLKTVPDEKIIRKLIGRVKERYPNVYKVLIEERNEVLAKNLNLILSKHPEKKIVAVIGAGHKKEVLELIKKPDISYSFNVEI